MRQVKIVFRADASLQIGSGHVMRCLTLADALTAFGIKCHFICRVLPGHLLDVIRQRGYDADGLSSTLPNQTDAVSGVSKSEKVAGPPVDHSEWLGCDWQTDAEQVGRILAVLRPDWLVVDHYALDTQWEAVLRPICRKLMVIDDLADRLHCGDVLLDPNLGRQAEDYAGLVPTHCKVLLGPNFALLQPAFFALRNYSLQRRSEAELKHLLIAMGGVDQSNVTAQLLDILRTCVLPKGCYITVVLGLTAPWAQHVQALAAQMPWPTRVLVNTKNMAQLMADSDLAIGAAGGMSWERCCLGLPTLLLVLADNQRSGARALMAARAVHLVDEVDHLAEHLSIVFSQLIDAHHLSDMSLAAREVTDGLGCERVVQALGVRGV